MLIQHANDAAMDHLPLLQSILMKRINRGWWRLNFKCPHSLKRRRVYTPSVSQVCVLMVGRSYVSKFLGFIKSRGYHSKAHKLGSHIGLLKEYNLTAKWLRSQTLDFPVAVLFSQRVLLATKAISVKTTGNDGLSMTTSPRDHRLRNGLLR